VTGQVDRDHIEMGRKQGHQIAKGMSRSTRAVNEQTNRPCTASLHMPAQTASVDKTTAVAIWPIATLDLPIWCAQIFDAQLPVSPVLR
jgi:hypothetical protein